MLAYDAPPESYKSYKNRVFKKHTDKITNQLRQIKDCSLNASDKKDLVKKLLEIINQPHENKQP